MDQRRAQRYRLRLPILITQIGNLTVQRSGETVDISSASHPFFTGKQKFIDAAGRVEKFQRKYKWGKKDEPEAAEPEKKPESEKKPKG